jgi:hypothetical protein
VNNKEIKKEAFKQIFTNINVSWKYLKYVMQNKDGVEFEK